MTTNSLFNDLIVVPAKYLFLTIPAAALVDWMLAPRATKKYLLLLAIVVGAASLAISRLVANFYFDPRPFVTYHFTPLIPHEPDNGFPSDHTLLSAVIAAVVTACNPKIGVGLWILTAVVGIARISAGLHTPIDVGGSVVIAAAAAIAAHALLRRAVPSLGCSRSSQKTAVESNSKPTQ